MTAFIVAVMALLLFVAGASAQDNAPKVQPIRLHPDNPHYFLFRGKPAILITSGEHYGAVMNLDFDYLPYLDELQSKGLNLTRTFSGSYREIPASFGITDNTLSPKRYICPWPSAPGAANKFDLTKWDPAYFQRLKDFVAQAGKRGIVVELTLFCTLYNDQLWDINPMNARNNVNGVGAVPRNEVYTLKHKDLQQVQDDLARKIVSEMAPFDNLYFEVCNEPYWEMVTDQWQQHMVAVIVSAEAPAGLRHLIAQNISNGSKKVQNPNPDVSILNFHYSTPPDSVDQNYALNRVIADDETGFKGKDDIHYRTEGWDFIIAGGAAYSSLDYSFTPAHPAGTLVDFKSPGGGGADLRNQLGILKRFMDAFDLIPMRPRNNVVKGGTLTTPLAGTPAQARATVRVLADVPKAYAIYLRGGSQADLLLDLPAGIYQAQWVNTKTGHVDKSEDFQHPGGDKKLISPPYSDDIALRIKAPSAPR